MGMRIICEYLINKKLVIIRIGNVLELYPI